MIATNLPARVSRTIRDQQLFAPGDTVILALSGGADSCVLLDILAGLTEFSPCLVIAHLNHQLRGAESDGDELFCRSLAERYGLPFRSRSLDVAALARRQGLNLEDAGRRARLEFLEDVARSFHATAIALAHHADDQAETVLMRLLRGSGMTGLRGMSFRGPGGRIRPLLNSRRCEIDAYLRARGLEHREDASNRDTAFLRNRIRHELLPLLEQYNPAIRERLVGTAALLADEDDLLEGMAEDLAARACHFGSDSVSCSLTRLEGEPQALKRRLVRRILAHLTGNGEHVTRRHIQAMEDLMDSPRPNATLNLFRGIRAVREYGTLRLSRGLPPEDLPHEARELPGPGRYILSDGSLLTLAPATAPPDPASLPATVALFDLEKAPFPWRVRTFTPGDRIAPFAMAGSKKVKELFMERRVPRDQRGRIPLIFCGDDLIWVCGLRTSRLAQLDAGSRNIIMAVYSPRSGDDRLTDAKERDREEKPCAWE
ncbi:tRNA lysidine(34) synthetase TilS [Pelobacter propionicus]|uniref:tRNA(Ile)-lysidine synthase n=1 Tax=Pelobacter propionicus (strain DSM 2379 / NBRC 103807 / OttBd1) TaxID=338966 RepID=A1AR85_PELPD|nr:tRNA lysidine(34) synthetase TilS [Pelobacter propionicus]ABK99855.1 tRNA(Ile)-lysidine synthetase [Pelobacter propionicus DSM 2379]